MSAFRIKAEGLLDERDFIEHPIWAVYSEPNDIDAIASYGFDIGEVRKVIADSGYSDEYAFPLPAQATTPLSI